MKRIFIVTLYILLALTACTPSGSMSQTPASEEPSQVEVTPSAPEPELEEGRVAAITPLKWGAYPGKEGRK